MAIASGEQTLPLFDEALEMLALTAQAFQRRDGRLLAAAATLGRSIHKREKDLTERLLGDPAAPPGLRFIPGHVERIGDAVEGLIRSLHALEAGGAAFTERGVREVAELFERSQELLACARDVVLTGNRVLARHVELESMRFQEIASAFAAAHEQRLVEGICQPAASSTYLAMLDYLREVVRHCRQAAARIVPTGRTGSGLEGGAAPPAGLEHPRPGNPRP
jgi:Na+/phosphate symporter